MTTAVGEMLKQAEQLSAEERVELATRLMEQARQSAEAASHNGRQAEAEAPPSGGTQESLGADEEEEDWLDTLDLKLMPPKRTYTARVRFHYAGRLEPLPYDFGDFFDDEEEVES